MIKLELLKIGNIAKSNKERIGIITKVYHNKYEKVDLEIVQYTGIGFDGKTWVCEIPVFLANNVDEYITIFHN